MNKKIIGIFICMLLIASPVLSASWTEENKSNNLEITLEKSDWIELDKILSSDGAENDEFGNSVSIDGDYAIVGAYCDNGCTGSAYIFKKDGSTWTEQAKLIPSDVESGDYAGLSVSISGDYAIIGAPVKEAAYVFIRSGTSWTQQAKLTATGGGDLDMFGWSVAISGEYAIVGGTNYDYARGAAFVFKRTDTTWIQEEKLLATDGTTNDKFGYVDINGDIAIVGAYNNDNDNGVDAGAAYIFKRETSGYWYQYSKIIANDGESNDNFGIDVAIVDDYAIIGAIGDDSNKGAAYIFRYIDGVGWQQAAKLIASDGLANDRFGNSVSIYQNYVAVGAFFDDSGTGSAYIFKDDGTNWAQEKKLTASDGAVDDVFGISASIYENNVIIGARSNDNENGDNAGAAYVFIKSGAKICCDGNLDWSSVKPNSEVTGDFQISNCGEEGSYLNWELYSVPVWGVWELSPDSGTDLAYGESVTIEVKVTVPSDENSEFTGKVKMINSDDPSDYCEIDVVLNTPKYNPRYLNFIQISWFLNRFRDEFPIIRSLFKLYI